MSKLDTLIANLIADYPRRTDRRDWSTSTSKGGVTRVYYRHILMCSDANAFASGWDYCQNGSPRDRSMSQAWLDGYDAAARDHAKYAASIDLPKVG